MRGRLRVTGKDRAPRPQKEAAPRPYRRAAAEISETEVVRVVGGKLRSRPIAGPKSQAVRPTSDRSREALFNILIHAYGDPVAGARVLDLFAGTGALGIEAISRGAAYALFVDEGVEARSLLRGNVETLGFGGVTRIFRRDATKLGPGASGRAVRPRVPRSALRQGPGRKGARLRARRRLAQAAGFDRGGGSGGRGLQGAGGIRGIGAAHIRRYGVLYFRAARRPPCTTRRPNSRSISVSFNST